VQPGLRGNWEAARIASSSLCLASVPSKPSMSVVRLAMQTEAMEIFASITSTQDTRVPSMDSERTLIGRNSRLYASSLERNHSLAERRQGIKRDRKREQSDPLISLNTSISSSQSHDSGVASSRIAHTIMIDALPMVLAYVSSCIIYIDSPQGNMVLPLREVAC
jgi:hypothetical protein